MTTTDGHFDMTAAPLRVSTVTLRVRNLPRLRDFYRDALGLAVLRENGTEAVLGTAEVPLLILRGDPALRSQDARQAGLFHTAFLMPSRGDLGRWVAHAGATGLRLQGASDHLVSEALYLSDPEGNGIEVYADRPVSAWHDARGNIRMATDPLDLDSLLSSGQGAEWQGMPQAGRIGHVHLQVGQTEAADAFYADVLGLDIAARYPGASFYGSGGYHHQLAGNTWNSRGAGPRDNGMTGLAEVALIARPDALDQIRARAGSTELHDPWGSRITVTADGH